MFRPLKAGSDRISTLDRIVLQAIDGFATSGLTTVFSWSRAVAGIDERVAFLEGRVVEHSRMIDGICEAIVSLEHRMDRRFEAIEHRFEAIDRRFDAVDVRFLGIDRRLDGIDRRIDGLDTRISRQFTWIVGLHVTTLAAVVAALLAR